MDLSRNGEENICSFPDPLKSAPPKAQNHCAPGALGVHSQCFGPPSGFVHGEHERQIPQSLGLWAPSLRTEEFRKLIGTNLATGQPTHVSSHQHRGAEFSLPYLTWGRGTLWSNLDPRPWRNCSPNAHEEGDLGDGSSKLGQHRSLRAIVINDLSLWTSVTCHKAVIKTLYLD